MHIPSIDPLNIPGQREAYQKQLEKGATTLIVDAYPEEYKTEIEAEVKTFLNEIWNLDYTQTGIAQKIRYFLPGKRYAEKREQVTATFLEYREVAIASFRESV